MRTNKILDFAINRKGQEIFMKNKQVRAAVTQKVDYLNPRLYITQVAFLADRGSANGLTGYSIQRKSFITYLRFKVDGFIIIGFLERRAHKL